MYELRAATPATCSMRTMAIMARMPSTGAARAPRGRVWAGAGEAGGAGGRSGTRTPLMTIIEASRPRPPTIRA